MDEQYRFQFAAYKIIRVLWSYNFSILLCIIFGVCASFIYLIASTPEYEIKTILAPRSPSSVNGSAVAAVGRQLGGLLGSGGPTGFGQEKIEQNIATLEAASFLKTLIIKNNSATELLAERWDARRRRWRPNHNILSGIVSNLRTIQPIEERVEPKDINSPAWVEAVSVLKKKLSVSTNPKNGLVTVTIHWHDPYRAIVWINSLVSLSNEIIRNKSLYETERNIKYIGSLTRQHTDVELTSAFTDLYRDQIKERMLAIGNSEYAFQYVDRPILPARASWPVPIFVIILGFNIGLITGLIQAGIRNYIRSAKDAFKHEFR